MTTVFAKPFLENAEYPATRRIWRQRLVANDREGLSRAVAGVMARRAFDDQLDRIAMPALVIAGELDGAVPLAEVERLHRSIVGSTLVVILGAGHTTPIESPAAVTAAFDAFLAHQFPSQALSGARR